MGEYDKRGFDGAVVQTAFRTPGFFVHVSSTRFEKRAGTKGFGGRRCCRAFVARPDLSGGKRRRKANLCLSTHGRRTRLCSGRWRGGHRQPPPARVRVVKSATAPGDYFRAGLPNSLRNSTFAASNTRRLSSVRPEPARLMRKVSIDIAEQKGELFRRSLNSAECFRERAISRGSSSLKTPSSRSSALLSCVTFCDQ